MRTEFTMNQKRFIVIDQNLAQLSSVSPANTYLSVTYTLMSHFSLWAVMRNLNKVLVSWTATGIFIFTFPMLTCCLKQKNAKIWASCIWCSSSRVGREKIPKLLWSITNFNTDKQNTSSRRRTNFYNDVSKVCTMLKIPFHIEYFIFKGSIFSI